MSNVTTTRSSVKSPSRLAREMGNQGYRIRFFGEGEALVIKPDGKTHYFVSLIGITWDQGCTCPGGRVHGKCKHLAVVSAFRPCDNPECGGIQEYIQPQTACGPTQVYQCTDCGKTTDPRIVQSLRDNLRRQRKSAA